MVTIGTTFTIVAILESIMSASIAPHAINDVSLLTRSGKYKSRYSSSERLQILGATQADLNATIRLFCPGRPLYAATRGKNEDPRDWTTPRGRLPDSEVLRHLTGNLTPEINPRWVAPHSWEMTRWVGIDVDFRNDRDDFKRRCKFVIEALARLGVPSEAILKSLTPSGGRHYRFFTTRNVRVTDIPPVMAMVGLHESSGQIEIFPKLNKGMRLPFGFIPGREHDPGKWLRFIRAYRRKRFPRVNWLGCLQRASQHADAELNPDVNRFTVSTVNTASSKGEVRHRRITQVNSLGIPRQQTNNTLRQSKDRYRELLSRPFGSMAEATELWGLGICAEGTRFEATKRMAWHLLFARRLPLKEAANKLVEWVYETGSANSATVRKDRTHGTRIAEAETRGLIDWMVDNHTSTNSGDQDQTHFSQAELDAIQQRLQDTATDKSLFSVALSFLRFAKLHGAPESEGWLVQISVNGVIRKWPGCHGMNYKPLIEALKASGLVELTREKRQSSNGTGRPRTYLIRVRPELRTGATLSHEEALQQSTPPVRPGYATQITAVSQENNGNTYRMSIHPTSSEKMRKNKGEAGQDGIRVESCSTSEYEPSECVIQRNSFRQAETARLAALSQQHRAPSLTSPLTIPRSSTYIGPSSGPVGQMVTTVHISGMGIGLGQWPRRFRQNHGPRPGSDSAPATMPLMLSDWSIISAGNGSQHLQGKNTHEHSDPCPGICSEHREASALDQG